MVALLTIRNLTATPISIAGIERFEDPNTRQSKPSIFPFGSGTTASLAPLSGKLGEHSQTFKQHNVDIKLLPFESYVLKEDEPKANNENISSSSNTTLRLTIETPGGDRYRVDSNPAYTQKSTKLFTPLTPAPSTSYSALYHPAKPTPQLTIHTNHSINPSTWMSNLPSTLPLSALSIPGTHNSHTYYRALPSVRCQFVSIKNQLENGIRFLDIRVQPVYNDDTSNKDLRLVHGAFPVSLTGPKYFEPVIDVCYNFLAQNPSETILISLKREGVGNSTDEYLSQILDIHYISPNKEKWYISSQIPYIDAVRGKLVLIRRYNLHHSISDERKHNGYGLDATSWPHNSTHATHGPFCVQDYCEIMEPTAIPHKLQYSNEHLVRAAECTAFIPGLNTDRRNPVPPGPLFLNFLSGSNFWKVGCWPGAIASVVNRGIEEWMCMGHHLDKPLDTPREPGRTSTEERPQTKDVVKRAKNGDGSTGIIIMDNVGEGGDWDLVRLIIGMNMGITTKVRDAEKGQM